MPSPTVLSGHICQVRLISYDPDTLQIGLNIVWAKAFNLIGGPVTSMECAQAINQVFKTLYKTVMASDCKWYGVGVRDYSIAPLPTEDIYAVDQGPGIVGGVTAPDQLCALITLKTGVAGPAGRGRKYIPFVPVSFIAADNKIDAAQLPSYALIALAFVDPVLVTGISGGTLNLQFGVAKADQTGFKPITDAILHPEIATQRRRSSYGKTNLLPT